MIVKRVGDERPLPEEDGPHRARRAVLQRRPVVHVRARTAVA